MVAPYVQQTYADLMAVLKDADLVVASSFSIVARLAVQKLNLPLVSVVLFPLAFISAEQPPYLMEFPYLPWMRKHLGKWSVQLALKLGQWDQRWRTQRIEAFRKEIGLPPVRGDEVTGETLHADWIVALYTPLLGPLPPDAPRNATIAGFTFYNSEDGGVPALDKSIDAFLSAGPPPLVFTLGSVVISAAGSFYEQAVDVARRLGKRALLLVGGDELAAHGGLNAPDVLVAGYAPHSLVMPRAAAVIHHGGIGTAGQAMRAGKPQLICPMFGDQGDNAERLTKLGIGRRLDLKEFSVAQAVADLNELLSGEVLARAAALGPQVALEDGAKVTAEGILKMLEGWRPRGDSNTRPAV